MIKPLGSRVLVEVGYSGEEEVTKTGLIITKSARDEEAKQTGKVVALGELVAEEIPVGSNILFTKYAGEKVEDNGIIYMIIDESDAIAIYEEE